MSGDSDPLHYRAEDLAPARPKSRERELRDAIKKSGLPFAAIALFRALLDAADFVTADLPPRFQPRSLDELAGWADMSPAHCKRMLNVLEEAGWVERKRPSTPGRGHRTSYALLLGRSRARRRERPLTEAERARRYRERKAAKDRVTPGLERGSGPRDKGAQECATKRLKARDECAGQGPICAEGQRGENEGLHGSGLVPCGVCGMAMDPVLPAAGFTTHPGCDPDEVSALLSERRR